MIICVPNSYYADSYCKSVFLILVLQTKKKTIEKIRDKRRRYRTYKKDQWRLWRERAEAYQKGVEEDMA